MSYTALQPVFLWESYLTPQQRFWTAFHELIFHGYLLQEHCQKTANMDRLVRAGLAITSTASLGIWAVFKAYPQLWAGIIVATQIVSATSKFLPYTSRLKASSSCAHDFREIQNWAEAIWGDIVDGEMTDEQVNKARRDLQTRTAKALKACFPLDGLPRNAKLNDQATLNAEQYLSTHHGS